MKKLLITGSNGFLGYYFLEHYHSKYEINTFSFLNDNFEDLKFKNIDIVVHLSALVHQMDGASSEEYEKVNVTQTLELAKRAKESGVKYFIFMSTVKVYGEETNTAYREDSLCKPEDEYGKSKLKAERELQGIEDDYFIVSIIRTPIIYGYGVKANIKNLISLINKVPALPFADIKNRRSMAYIGNLCHLIDTVIEKEKSGIFLASDDKPLSTSKLIEFIADALDKKIYLIKIPCFEVFLKFLKLSFHKRLYESLEIDNTKTKEILDFKNLFTVEDGIKYMIKGENR